jgi:hypothetical protein
MLSRIRLDEVSTRYWEIRFTRENWGCGGVRRLPIGVVMNVQQSQIAIPLGLHVCPGCSSHLVQPTCWERTPKRGHWRLWRRCPDCEWITDSIHGEDEIDAYDEQLDFGTRELAEELRTLERSNMEQMAANFITALNADLIGPDDFCLAQL